MKCWKCGTEIQGLDEKRISFRAICDKCTAWLHCCKNCKNYKPGLPNDCAIPDTEYIADREASNFCEDFELLGSGPNKTADPNEVARKLFGDDLPDDDKKNKEPPKKRFDSLFKDEDEKE
jgi:hypothetical protein